MLGCLLVQDFKEDQQDDGVTISATGAAAVVVLMRFI